jgi:hypothetical protein
MPELIEHIDAIARKKQRDVLNIRFYTRDTDLIKYDHLSDPERLRVIVWLEEHAIPWQPCGPVADEQCMSSYRGDVYVEVPYDTTNPTYQLLQTYLENPDGTMRHPTVTFLYYPLELAMKNAHHDEPGFWERWAENF